MSIIDKTTSFVVGGTAPAIQTTSVTGVFCLVNLLDLLLGSAPSAHCWLACTMHITYENLADAAVDSDTHRTVLSGFTKFRSESKPQFREHDLVRHQPADQCYSSFTLF